MRFYNWRKTHRGKRHSPRKGWGLERRTWRKLCPKYEDSGDRKLATDGEDRLYVSWRPSHTHTHHTLFIMIHFARNIQTGSVYGDKAIFNKNLSLYEIEPDSNLKANPAQYSIPSVVEPGRGRTNPEYTESLTSNTLSRLSCWIIIIIIGCNNPRWRQAALKNSRTERR